MPLLQNDMVKYGKKRIVRRTVAVVHAVATVLFCVVTNIISHLFQFVKPFALFLLDLSQLTVEKQTGAEGSLV